MGHRTSGVLVMRVYNVIALDDVHQVRVNRCVCVCVFFFLLICAACVYFVCVCVHAWWRVLVCVWVFACVHV